MGGKYRGRGLRTENDQINIPEQLAKEEAGHVISCHVTLIRMGYHSFFGQSSSTLSVLSKLSTGFKSLPERLPSKTLVRFRQRPGDCSIEPGERAGKTGGGGGVGGLWGVT